MASYRQYRITVNGTQGEVLNSLPSQQWSRIAQVIEDRGGVAMLEWRTVFDESLEDVTVRVGAHHVTLWEYGARVEYR